MFKSILLVDPDSQFQKRKCKSCSKNDWSQNPLLLSCLKCGYVFCQDCSKNDLVLLHSECTDPAYQVLISRGFFDLFSKPAGTCSSCHMAFSKGKSLLMSSGFWSNPLTRKSFILWEMPNLCPGRQRSLALSSLPPPRRPKASAISCKHTC